MVGSILIRRSPEIRVIPSNVTRLGSFSDVDEAMKLSRLDIQVSGRDRRICPTMKASADDTILGLGIVLSIHVVRVRESKKQRKKQKPKAA